MTRRPTLCKALVVGVLLMGFAAVHPAHGDCERCKSTFRCTIDECFAIDACQPVTSFGGLAWTDCQDDGQGYCAEAGDFCRYAELTSPTDSAAGARSIPILAPPLASFEVLR